jgi:hypothetical protein
MMETKKPELFTRFAHLASQTPADFYDRQTLLACPGRPALASDVHPRGAISSVGRASRLHRECRRFEPVIAHHMPTSSNALASRQQAEQDRFQAEQRD